MLGNNDKKLQDAQEVKFEQGLQMLRVFKTYGTTLENPSSSSPISFPESGRDIVSRILLFSPVVSLLRSKLVCKGWREIIEDPSFTQGYADRVRLGPVIRGLLLKTQPGLYKYYYVPLYGNQNFWADVPSSPLKIRNSCNGLICCLAGDQCTVYNPATRQSRNLPPVPYIKFMGLNMVLDVSLGFDPLKSPHYKVCSIIGDVLTSEFSIKLFSSEIGSWYAPHHGDLFLEKHKDLFQTSGVYWEGSLHWLCRSRNHSFCFDMEQEREKPMPMPPLSIESWDPEIVRVGYFGECRGHLAVIDLYQPFYMRFDILEMKADYSEWERKYVINIEIPHLETDFEILHLEIEEDEKRSYMILKVSNKILLFKIFSKKVEIIHYLHSVRLADGSLGWNCLPIVESLASI